MSAPPRARSTDPSHAYQQTLRCHGCFLTRFDNGSRQPVFRIDALRCLFPTLQTKCAMGRWLIASAGVYRGRKPSVDAVEVKRLKAEGLGASQIAKRLKIGRASVYRVLEA